MSLRLIVFTYLALVTLLLVAFFALAIFADIAEHSHNWIENATNMILDMTKIAVGAAVGSLTTAAGAIAKRNAHTS